MDGPVQINIEAAKTALLLIDFQNFTTRFDTVPISGMEAATNAARLAACCRSAGIHVVLVRVGHPDRAVPGVRPAIDTLPAGFSTGSDGYELAPILDVQPTDIIVDKYNWGAFHGTNLDTHLRRRGIETLVVGGLVLGIGVDTTMREAMAMGFNQILASDATASFSTEEYDYTMKSIIPRLARIRTVDEIIAAIEK